MSHSISRIQVLITSLRSMAKFYKAGKVSLYTWSGYAIGAIHEIAGMAEGPDYRLAEICELMAVTPVHIHYRFAPITRALGYTEEPHWLLARYEMGKEAKKRHSPLPSAK